MRSSGLRPKKKGLDTIWEDYWVLCERKNITQMSNNAVGVVYHQLHHFLTEATWDAERLNERRLQVIQQCNQTKLKRGFTLIKQHFRML
jgi:SRSO17 transposase